MPNTQAVVLVIASALFCSPALAEGTAGTTGNDLLKNCSSTNDNSFYLFYRGYCMGFIRAVWQMSSRGCGPAGVPMGEVVQLFIEYAKGHSEWLHRPAEEVVEAAIIKAFPCNRK